jgi:uncharacterized protein
MKPFIHLFKTKKNNYVYDVNSNDILKINDTVFDFLHLYQSGLKIEDVKEIMNEEHSEEEIENIYQNIKKSHDSKMLFSSNRPDKIAMFCCKDGSQEYYDKYINQLTLEVTQRCNMSCRYCTFSKMYGCSQENRKNNMTWETAKKGLDIMIKHGGKSPDPFLFQPFGEPDFRDYDIVIGFYGGEPLLNFTLIQKCVSYLEEQLPPGKKVGYTISTNGTLLTEDIISYLLQKGISICLSLDGPKCIHDKARIYPDGKGTFDDVYNSLLMISRIASDMKLEKPAGGTILCTVMGGYDYRKLYDFFLSLESVLNVKNLEYGITVSNITGGLEKWNSFFPDDKLEEASGFDDLLEEYKQACFDGLYKDKNTLDWKYKILHEFVGVSCYFDVHGRTRYQFKNHNTIPEFSHPGAICRIGSRRPILRSDGIISPCERVSFDEQYLHIGDENNGICVEKCLKIIDDFTDATREDCKNCWSYWMCKIPCVSEYIESGTINADLKKQACIDLRQRRHEELIGMMEMLEIDSTCLDHFNEIVSS